MSDVYTDERVESELDDIRQLLKAMDGGSQRNRERVYDIADHIILGLEQQDYGPSHQFDAGYKLTHIRGVFKDHMAREDGPGIPSSVDDEIRWISGWFRESARLV